jgi:hypothetical protein
MLFNLIAAKKNEWLASKDCSITSLLEYIRGKGELRDTQIEAIETYLFLKIKAENKPLHQLFSEGFFLFNDDLAKISMTTKTRDYLSANRAARSLFEFSRLPNKETETNLPALETQILMDPESLDYPKIFRDIFYGIDYADYLFSLPMGAGKTFLMAAFIYLDLYFAQNEPENKLFAHNFIILVPSGLKSSIVPSLKSIEKFDPSWLLPEPAASEVKRILSFEVLDQLKSAKKSNRAINPNAQKVNQHLKGEDPIGNVFVVNAEKVILDRLDLSDQLQLIEHTEDEKDRKANELRNLIGKIPNLQLHIDEVHHAATDDIKLRKVVSNWNANGTINSVLGYSGTPYLSSTDDIEINNDLKLRFAQITNTVYYYSLIRAVKSFLKAPQLKSAKNLSSIQIIEKGIEEFKSLYWNKSYSNGAVAKLAIYCGSIERLESEVYPFIVSTLQIPEKEILKYHKGNKKHKLPKENDLEWNLLDSSYSKRKIILLVQVGKEGWDCKSLTGVILSQSGDCPKNMVLQTSCRCLRQVDKKQDETALIWLSKDNEDILAAQLKAEQQTTIAELNSIGGKAGIQVIERFSRVAHLKLPEVKFYQLRILYKTLLVEENVDISANLTAIFSNLGKFLDTVLITTSDFDVNTVKKKSFIHTSGNEDANYTTWLLDISRESFFNIPYSDLKKYSSILKSIFDKITYMLDDTCFYNEQYHLALIKSKIRLAFSPQRNIESESEIIPANANLLLVEKLKPIENSEKLYPSQTMIKEIQKYDKTGLTISELEIRIAEENKHRIAAFVPPVQDALFAPTSPTLQPDLISEVKIKDKTFHYVPYNFIQSQFEKNILLEVFKLSTFSSNNLEIYYNGDRFLTSFKIQCFAKNKKSWHSVGEYTPDFLIISRKAEDIHKALIIETKGQIYSTDVVFMKKKNFIETEFLKQNNDKFGYKRFDYVYLEEDKDINVPLAKLDQAITNFFKD